MGLRCFLVFSDWVYVQEQKFYVLLSTTLGHGVTVSLVALVCLVRVQSCLPSVGLHGGNNARFQIAGASFLAQGLLRDGPCDHHNVPFLARVP